MAARLKLTPEVQKRICDAVAIGATYDLAAKYGGVSYESLRLLREKSPAFAAALQEAEGRGAIGWLAKIERAANEGTWQAAAWKLERRYPQEYGRTVNEHTGPGGGPIRQTTEHTGVVEVKAVDYRHSIRALAPPDEEAAG